MKNKFILVCSLIFLISFQLSTSKENLSSNSSSISGFVSDEETGETLIGATVSIKNARLGAYTNKSGFYSISGLEQGDYEILISCIGYETKLEKIKFNNQNIRRDFKLKISSVETEEVSVEANKDVEQREIMVSKVNIPVQQIKKFKIGGESDVFRALQYLPGVLTSSQISSGLFVRGGSPDQNLVLLDGTSVYNPSHIFGFISTFNSEAIKDVELIKGGFPAEFGGRLSAVLNLTQKDGNKSKVEGLGSIGLLSSRLSLEGPIGNGSWFLGGRRTYLEVIKAFIPDDPESPFPDFNFYDVNAKITQNLTDDDKISLSGFLSADNFSIESYGMKMKLEVGNRLAAGKWTHLFSNSLFFTVNISGSQYINTFKGDNSGYEFLIDNSITDYTIKGALEWFPSEELTTKIGFESTDFTFKYLQNFTGNTDSTKTGSSGGTINLKVNDWNHSLFAQTNYRITELLSLQAGLRANYWTLSEEYSFDPRLALRYQILDNFAIKAAFGIFHQSLRLASQPDFSFFDTWLPTDSSISISKSIHYILSLETKPTEGYDLNFDLYYKRFSNINEINMNAITVDVVKDVFYVGNANAYGAEVFLQKKTGKLSGWIGYAIGYIFATFKEVNNGKEFRPKYDRLHDLKIVLQYTINDDWDIGASFTFQSGQSYTGATSRFQSRLPDDNYGRGKIIPSQRYGLRLPPSHQLNVNVSYSFKTLGLNSKLIFDIYNIYNRRDIWFRYYNTQELDTKVEDVRLLPIIPSISYEIKF